MSDTLMYIPNDDAQSLGAYEWENVIINVHSSLVVEISFSHSSDLVDLLHIIQIFGLHNALVYKIPVDTPLEASIGFLEIGRRGSLEFKSWK